MHVEGGRAWREEDVEGLSTEAAVWDLLGLVDSRGGCGQGHRAEVSPLFSSVPPPAAPLISV